MSTNRIKNNALQLKTHTSFITLLSLLCLPFVGLSQIVNIENQRLSAKKEGFSGSVELNLNYTVNTKNLLQLGSNLKIAHKKQRHYTMLIGDHSLVRSDDESFINNGFEHVRYNYTLKDSGRIVYEAYQQGQFNKVQRINLRILVGTGFRFLLIDQQNYQLNLGAGLMGEYEELSTDEISRDILSANYISFDAQFSESIGLNSITYFQPKLVDFGNYRLSNETHLRFRINKYLTFKMIYSLTHDSRNIEDVRKTNYSVRNAVSFNF